jgi:hypothetical protein
MVRERIRTSALVCLVAFLALPGCATVTLKPADFSWSFESVLTADASGYVKGEPKTIAFNANELFKAEKREPGAAAGSVVRVIRNADGYYFVTSPGFKHVYIFTGATGKLALKKRVLIAEQGMDKPFFNRRDQGVELVANGQTYLLGKKGIISGGKK